jgi:hypothetical protein
MDLDSNFLIFSLGLCANVVKSKKFKMKYIRFCTCCNPSLGFMTKARACKGAGQKVSLRVTSHALKSVGKCEE